jgi:glutamyl-tRNA reductase
MEFHCWGISHKSTSLEVREKFAFNKDKIDEILAKLKTLTAFDNGIFLSTCNRTEFYSFCPRIEIKKFDAHLESILGKGLEVRKNDQYLFSDNDAFAHLLRVMTGIDSMIVGEPDIFGQVKKAYENSRSFGYLNSNLDSIFSKSINITKEIRSATNLSKNPVSIASLVENIILKEGHSPVLIIGAGDVGKPLLKRLIANGYEVALFNRSKVEVDGIKSNPLSKLTKNINEFKTIVVAAPSDKEFFGSKDFKTSEDRLIFDLAIPRNLDGSLNNLKNFKLLTLDEISMMVEENIKGRKDSVAQAEEIIEKNSETEFRKIKNKKNIDLKQKEFRESLTETRDEAVNKAKKRILKGDDIENIIDDLASEIASKNAFQVSKILDSSTKNK